MKELLFLFVLFVSNVIQAITGFAGTVLAICGHVGWNVCRDTDLPDREI